VGRLPHQDRAVEDQELAISDIVLWELAKLVQLGRLEFNLESPSPVGSRQRISNAAAQLACGYGGPSLRRARDATREHAAEEDPFRSD
jgi:hypothetical protein